MNYKEKIVSKEEFESFVDNSLSQMRESDVNFDKWHVNYFIYASQLVEFLNCQTQLIGKTVNTILTMGCIFNRDELSDKEKYLDLDEPVVVIIDGIQVEIWCYTDSRVKIGINSLTLREKSYQPYDWCNCSDLFKSDIIGQKVVGFEVKKSESGFYDSLGLGDRPDGGDYFETFSIILENGESLVFCGETEHMSVYMGKRIR